MNNPGVQFFAITNNVASLYVILCMWMILLEELLRDRCEKFKLLPKYLHEYYIYHYKNVLHMCVCV